MSDARIPFPEMTPEQEDRALFRTYGGPIAVALVPRINWTDAQTLLVRGFFDDTTEISVVFSGRRAQETGPLEAHLRWLDTRARYAAAAAQRPAPHADLIRLEVQIKGSWRHSFRRDEDGNEVRSFQLIAARWAFTDHTGKLQQFGVSPSVDTKTRRRQKSYILGMREIDAVPQTARGQFRPD